MVPMDDEHHDAEHTNGTHGQHKPQGYADAGSHAHPGGLTVAAEGLRLEASET